MVFTIKLSSPAVTYYNISENSVTYGNSQVEISSLDITFSKINFIGLQRIEFDEETKFTYIDESVYYIPLNIDIIKSLNSLYLDKNEMYVEINSQNLQYKKITDKKISCIIIDPYHANKPNKQLIEFTNKEDIFPYNFGTINIQNNSSYHVKLIIKHGNTEIYNNNILVEIGVSYSIHLNNNLQCDKKPNSFKITVINLTDDTNIRVSNINYNSPP